VAGVAGLLMVTGRGLLWFDNAGQSYAHPDVTRFEEASKCNLIEAGYAPRILCTSDAFASYYQLIARRGWLDWHKYRSIRLAPPERANLVRQTGWSEGLNVLILGQEAGSIATLVELPRSAGPIAIHPISPPPVEANWPICTEEQRHWPKLTFAREANRRLVHVSSNPRSGEWFPDIAIDSLVIHAKDKLACVSGLHGTRAFTLEPEERLRTAPDKAVALRWTKEGIMGSMYDKRNRSSVETSHRTVRCRLID
jgi:hypothetical protein